MISTLRNNGSEPHLTSLGGRGVSILHPKPSASDDQVNTSEGDVNEGMVVPKRAALRDVPVDGLATWAEELGHWTTS